MRKKVISIIAAFIFLFVIVGYTSADTRVFDEAELYSDQEEAELELELVQAIENLQCDIVILTVQDADGLNTMEYAENFYTDNECGYESVGGTGVVFVIDMDNRQVWITTSGDAITYINDNRINLIIDEVYDDVVDGDYYEATKIFIGQMETYMRNDDFYSDDKGSGNIDYVDTYDGETHEITFWGNATQYIIPEVIISIIIAGISVLVVANANKTKQTINNHTYSKNDEITIYNQTDQYTHTTSVRTKIPTNKSGGGSTTHRGGGGGSFGGGGRGF